MTPETLVVLMAEDDDGHASLVTRNLKRSGITNTIIHVKDGQEALDFIHCRDGYAQRVPNGPLLLLLDINMPRVDGVEVLRQLRQQEYPGEVIIITGSYGKEQAWALEPQEVIGKPIDLEQLLMSIQLVLVCREC